MSTCMFYNYCVRRSTVSALYALLSCSAAICQMIMSMRLSIWTKNDDDDDNDNDEIGDSRQAKTQFAPHYQAAQNCLVLSPIQSIPPTRTRQDKTVEDSFVLSVSAVWNSHYTITSRVTLDIKLSEVWSKVWAVDLRTQPIRGFKTSANPHTSNEHRYTCFRHSSLAKTDGTLSLLRYCCLFALKTAVVRRGNAFDRVCLSVCVCRTDVSLSVA